MTIWTKQSPSIRPPDLASEVAGWAAPPRPRVWPRLRAAAARHPFLLLVLLPTLLASVYFLGFAAPQYDSEARFMIKGSAPSGVPASLSDLARSGAMAASGQDSLAVRDYLASHDAVHRLGEKLPLIDIFRRPEADPLARLWWANPPAERLLDYYQRMVAADFDTTSGITTLRVRSFRPEDSKAIAEQLLTLSEDMVNRLNKRQLADALRIAREEYDIAEARLTRVQLAMTSFREREKAVDPARTAGITLDIIGKLDGALAQARAELTEAQRYTRPDNPRVLQLQNRVAALEAQVATERARSTSGETALPQQIGEYERLNVERELARGMLASATASLERARVEAQKQQIFIQRVVEPNLAEYARYPKAIQSILYVFFCLSLLYGLLWLLVAGMREHAS